MIGIATDNQDGGAAAALYLEAMRGLPGAFLFPAKRTQIEESVERGT